MQVLTQQIPFDNDMLRGLKCGDRLLVSGIIYTARDKAHERIRSILESGGKLPFELKGQLIYYTGPTPARNGMIIGSAGPTTSYRMDPYSDMMLSLGIKGMIGKGNRDLHTKELLQKWNAVYFSTFAGAGAYLSKRIVAASQIAFEDLGPEAVYKLEVREFPLIVINDVYGGDLYEHTVKIGKGF